MKTITSLMILILPIYIFAHGAGNKPSPPPPYKGGGWGFYPSENSTKENNDCFKTQAYDLVCKGEPTASSNLYRVFLPERSMCDTSHPDGKIFWIEDVNNYDSFQPFGEIHNVSGPHNISADNLQGDIFFYFPGETSKTEFRDCEILSTKSS